MATTVQVYWQKRIDNSRLVRERDPEYTREWGVLVAGALVCLAVFLVCAWQQFSYVQSGYELEELHQRLGQVEEWNRALRVEHATLTDPERIDAWARNELGLDTPRAGQWIPVGAEERAVEAPTWARAATLQGPAGRGAAAVEE